MKKQPIEINIWPKAKQLFPWWLSLKESVHNVGDLGSIPGLGRSPGGTWQPTLVFLPGESHGLRSLAGYSPWKRKEKDRTESKHSTTYLNRFNQDWPPKNNKIQSWVRERKQFLFLDHVANFKICFHWENEVVNHTLLQTLQQLPLTPCCWCKFTSTEKLEAVLKECPQALTTAQAHLCLPILFVDVLSIPLPQAKPSTYTDC